MTQQTDHIPDSRKKVTAVEWLLENLCYVHRSGAISINIHPDSDITDIIKQAKAMEKEQIKNAHMQGQLFKHNPYAIHRISDQAEIYYKEKYEGQEHQDQLNNPTPHH